MTKKSVSVHESATPKNGQLIRRNTEFDFRDLDSASRNRVQKETAIIRDLLHRTAENVIQIGLRLKGVHDFLGRDVFQGWLLSQFRWSQSTASNYMQAAARFCEVKCLERFQPSALFELSRNKTSDEARAEALDRAKQGEIITKALAQLLIRTHSRKPTRQQRTLAYHAVRTLKDLNRKVARLNPAEADEVRSVLVELLAEVDKVRLPTSQGTSPTNTSMLNGALDGESDTSSKTPQLKNKKARRKAAKRRRR